MTYTCNHCEEGYEPVTPENGISLKYPVGELEIDLYLHHVCAAAWSSHFGIPIPPVEGAYAAQVGGASVGTGRQTLVVPDLTSAVISVAPHF